MKEKILELLEKCKGMSRERAVASLAGAGVSCRVSTAQPDVIIWWSSRFNLAGTIRVSC